MSGTTGTAFISPAQKYIQVLDKAAVQYIIVRSFVRSHSVSYTRTAKSAKQSGCRKRNQPLGQPRFQLNDNGCTNPLLKKTASKHSPADTPLRLRRIFFAAEPYHRSAFLFLPGPVFCFMRQNGQRQMHTVSFLTPHAQRTYCPCAFFYF